MYKKMFCLSAILILFLFTLVACGNTKKTPAVQSPFSELTWSSTVDDMVEIEGKDYDTYDSIYGGISYTYPKVFNEKSGTVKYMFDDKNQLMCIAWAYSCKDVEELDAIYTTINNSVNNLYGESNYNTDKDTNYGNVWRLEEGNITLSALVTSSNKAIQYAYINPANRKE